MSGNMEFIHIVVNVKMVFGSIRGVVKLKWMGFHSILTRRPFVQCYN